MQYKKDASDYVNNMQTVYTEAQLALMKIQQKQKEALAELKKTEASQATAKEAWDKAKQTYAQLSEEVKEAYRIANNANRGKPLLYCSPLMQKRLKFNVL